MTYIGLDLGTSGLKAVLMDELGQVLTQAQIHLSTQTPQPGWSEQDPVEWIQALDRAMEQLSQHGAFTQLAGLAVAGHMHWAVVLGRDDAPLRPCILWNDGRADIEAAMLDGQGDFVRLTGNRVFAGFTAPKLLWLKTNEPDVFRQIRRVLLPASYLNLYLTGDAVADCSDAAGSGWMDMAQRQFSERLLAHTELGLEHMPRLVEGCEPAGVLRAELAARWGLSQPVVVAGGAADNAAAACGMGVAQEDEGFVSLGTSGVVLVGREVYQPRPETAVHTFCHAMPDRWYQMSVMLSATDSLNWLASLLNTSPQALMGQVGDHLQAPVHAQFFPYLSGERTPHNNPNLRGALIGLSAQTDSAELTRAVVTGVSFALADGLASLQDAGAAPDQLWAVGGGAQSDYWLGLLATVFDRPIHRPAGAGHGAALGAARLAQSAAGAIQPSDFPSPQSMQCFEPDQGLRSAYQEAFAQYLNASRGRWLEP